MAEFPLPFLLYDRLRAAADRFLDEYHPSRSIPVPIEQIAETRLRMDIVPVPGLEQTLQSDDFGVVGYITSDLKEIHVRRPRTKEDQGAWPLERTQTPEGVWFMAALVISIALEAS